MGESLELPAVDFKVPTHLAVIMDGNGRWAKQQGLERVEGHKAGVKTVRMMVEECRRLGVRYLTLYSFSSENWSRPKEEVAALMGFFEHYLYAESDRLFNNGIRLRAIGDIGRLPEGVQVALKAVADRTADLDGMDLVLAVSYGGRDELVNAAKILASRVLAGELRIEQIDQVEFQSSLYAPDIPDPDLLLRTSDEQRISNFLLWQLAYTEIVVSSKHWPEFSAEDLRESFRSFSKRQRRFGLTGEQITDAGSS